MDMLRASRRSLLKGLSATTALCLWDAPLKFAFAAVPGDRRLVVVILRGGGGWRPRCRAAAW